MKFILRLLFMWRNFRLLLLLTCEISSYRYCFKKGGKTLAGSHPSSACIYNGFGMSTRATNKIKKRCSDLQVKNVDWVAPNLLCVFSPYHVVVCSQTSTTRPSGDDNERWEKNSVSFLPASTYRRVSCCRCGCDTFFFQQNHVLRHVEVSRYGSTICVCFDVFFISSYG